ncbi:hypothetical protein ES703_66068 [subsurface metagenome]
MVAKKIIGAGIAVAGAGLAVYAVYNIWFKGKGTRMVVTEEPPGSVPPGQEFSFGGYLEDVEGNRLAGKAVELYVNDEVVTSGTTDAVGGWDWKIVLDKSAVIYAKFLGDEEYRGC